jgi:membrane-bound inhibitor of C-type lysozyme
MRGTSLTFLLRTVFLAGVMLFLAGCATAPSSAVPEDAARDIKLPAATHMLGEAAVYVSASGKSLEVVHDSSGGVAIVKLPGGGMAALPAEIAGSEERYRNERMTLWEKDGTALLWLSGELVFSGKLVN